MYVAVSIVRRRTWRNKACPFQHNLSSIYNTIVDWPISLILSCKIYWLALGQVWILPVTGWLFSLMWYACNFDRYVRNNGEVWLQSNLSRTRPIIYGSKVDCKLEISKISSRGGVTLALTKSGCLYHYKTLPNGMLFWYFGWYMLVHKFVHGLSFLFCFAAA